MIWHKNTPAAINAITLASLRTARHIVVLGAPGSGKSVFSSQLAGALHLSRIALDDLYWETNWTRPAAEVFLQRLTQALQGDEWVLDGNYHHTYLDERIHQADTIIFLDVPTSIALRGLILRSLKRYFGERSSLPRNVAMGLDYRPIWELRPKLFWLTYSFKWRVRPLLLQKLDTLAAQKSVIVLASHRETRELLAMLEKTEHCSTWLDEWS